MARSSSCANRSGRRPRRKSESTFWNESLRLGREHSIDSWKSHSKIWSRRALSEVISSSRKRSVDRNSHSLEHLNSRTSNFAMPVRTRLVASLLFRSEEHTSELQSHVNL